MTLDDYIKLAGLTDGEFADKIGVARPSVTRYRNGTSRPDWTVMDEIIRVTAGAVLPNDFIQSNPWNAPAGRGLPAEPVSLEDELDAVLATQVL